MGNATSDLACMENMCREGRFLPHDREEEGPLCQRKHSFGPRKTEIPFGVRAPAPEAGQVLAESREILFYYPPTDRQFLKCKTSEVAGLVFTVEAILCLEFLHTAQRTTPLWPRLASTSACARRGL